jgi:phosphate transporter
LETAETTPLNAKKKQYSFEAPSRNASSTGLAEAAEIDESIDFFPVIVEEISKINSFYIGKLAQLRLAVQEILAERRNSYRSHHTSSDTSYLLRLRDIYVDLAALRSYCELNKTGFYKIIKKYDKIMNESTLETWLKNIDRQPFSNTTDPIELMDGVTSLVSRDKLIEWERFATEQQIKTTDDIFPSVRWTSLLIAILLFAASLYMPFIIPNDPIASRCLSLLILAVGLWITEAIPYFATALLIPILVVVMQVLRDPNNTSRFMTHEVAANFVTDHMFNHTTMLLLGGYTISTAFSRCQLELRLADYLQRYLGHRPHLFILAIMFLGLFLSMWISNHTAPILCATIILPVVRDLPTDSKFSKALLLGLAYACNIGGK